MNYEDKRIIAARRKEARKAFHNVETGIYIKNKRYDFQEVVLFEATLSIMLPQVFLPMESEGIRYRYPSEFRPQNIFGDESGRVNMTFSEFDESRTWDQLPAVLRELQTTILNTNPAVLVLHYEIMEIQGNRVPWMDFKSYGMDGALYNYMFLFLNGDQTVLGMFNCPYADRQDWSYLFVKCLETMHSVTKS